MGGRKNQRRFPQISSQFKAMVKALVEAGLGGNASEEREARPSSLWTGLRRPCCAGLGAIEEEFAFACVARERCGALELRPCLGEAAELEKKIAADAGQEVVGLERRLRGERVNELETRCRTECHGEGDRAIQLDDRRRHSLGERVVERGDALPVRFRGSTRASVTCGDGGLQSVRAAGATQLFGVLKGGETSMDEELIPAGTVLIEEQNRLPRGANSRA